MSEPQTEAGRDYARLGDLRDAIIEAVRTQDGVGGIKAFAAYEDFIEAQARHAALAEVRRGVEGLPRYDETLDTLTDDADGAAQHLGVYDPNAVYLAAVLAILEEADRG